MAMSPRYSPLASDISSVSTRRRGTWSSGGLFPLRVLLITRIVLLEFRFARTARGPLPLIAVIEAPEETHQGMPGSEASPAEGPERHGIAVVPYGHVAWSSVGGFEQGSTGPARWRSPPWAWTPPVQAPQSSRCPPRRSCAVQSAEEAGKAGGTTISTDRLLPGTPTEGRGGLSEPMSPQRVTACPCSRSIFGSSNHRGLPTTFEAAKTDSKEPGPCTNAAGLVGL
jgi:hypothetical protein